MLDGARLDFEALEELARLSASHVRLQHDDAAHNALIQTPNDPAAHVRLNDDRTAIAQQPGALLARQVATRDRLDLDEGATHANVSATLDTAAPRALDANGRARLAFPLEESNLCVICILVVTFYN